MNNISSRSAWIKLVEGLASWGLDEPVGDFDSLLSKGDGDMTEAV